MKLIQLDISAIRQSDSQNNAYVLLLHETNGSRQLPIVIGWCEARAIAIALDGSQEPGRPLTHDLFKTFSDQYNIIVEKIVIHTLVEGIFHSAFYCRHKETGKEAIIDARTSDSVALAIRYSCPIFTHEDILKRAGIIIKRIDEKKEQINTEKDSSNKKENISSYSLDKLNTLLKEAIQKENYEIASKLRDEINKRKKK